MINLKAYVRLKYKSYVDNRSLQIICDDWVKTLTRLLRGGDIKIPVEVTKVGGKNKIVTGFWNDIPMT